MAVNRVYKFKDAVEVQFFLNGGVFGSPLMGGQPIAFISGLVGKTFKTKAPGPVGTCTFVAGASPPGGDPTALFFKDIKAQIEAAIAGVKVMFSDGKVAIQESTPASGTVIDKTGTANQFLGFDTALDSAGKVYSPAAITVTPPVWVWAETIETAHVIYTWE